MTNLAGVASSAPNDSNVAGLRTNQTDPGFACLSSNLLDLIASFAHYLDLFKRQSLTCDLLATQTPARFKHITLSSCVVMTSTNCDHDAALS